ncbi:hypothetical protein BDQ12DRAFT_689543 [Crucibulum laeve]|uniref:Casein kinase II subunit beta n=1 Tax=Crucibulum laeve TaxID=68775 RepID=A0A5C3M0R5_9AGAR|nr:hypothetical protein BDQ12DRAFT_689543 [Crucibulum laeve]
MLLRGRRGIYYRQIQPHGPQERSCYAQAPDLIAYNLDKDIQEKLRGSLDVQARLLYGLIHACWIVTACGLSKMVHRIDGVSASAVPRLLHAHPAKE